MVKTGYPGRWSQNQKNSRIRRTQVPQLLCSSRGVGCGRFSMEFIVIFFFTRKLRSIFPKKSRQSVLLGSRDFYVQTVVNVVETWQRERRTIYLFSTFFFFFWRSRYAPVSENCRRRRRWPGDVSPRAIDRQQYNNYRVRPNTYDEYSIADCRRRPAQVISSTTTTMPQSHVHIYTCRSAHTRVPFLWRVQKETRIPCIIINVCVIYTRRVPRIGHCASTVTS